MSLSEGHQGKKALQVRAERTPGEVAVSRAYRAKPGQGSGLALEPTKQTHKIEAGEASYLF